MIVGIYTKQTAVVFGPLLFLYVLLFEQEAARQRGFEVFVPSRLRSALRAAAPSFLVAVPLFLFNQLYMTPATTVSSNTAMSRADYLLTQFYVVAHYTGNFLLPIRLSADPDIKIIQGWSDPRLLLGLVIILILAAFALVSARNPRSRPIAFGIAWFFVALAPTSSLVPLYQLANDHRTFLPTLVCHWQLDGGQPC